MGVRILAILAAALFLSAAAPAPPPELPAYAPVTPGPRITFPADHGAHPAFRTEWWYVTGWLKTPDHKDLGFQITFFRSRPPVDQRNPSAFAPKQILFARPVRPGRRPSAARPAHRPPGPGPGQCLDHRHRYRPR